MDLSILSVRSLQDIPAPSFLGGNSILQSYLNKEISANTVDEKKHNKNISKKSGVITPAELCSVIPNQTLPKRKMSSDVLRHEAEMFSEEFDRSLSFTGDASPRKDVPTNKTESAPTEEEGGVSSPAETNTDMEQVSECEPMDLSLPKVKLESNTMNMMSKNEEENDDNDIEVLQILNEESHLNQRRPRLSSETLSKGFDWHSLLLQPPFAVPQVQFGGNHQVHGFGLGHPTMVNQTRHVEKPVWPVRSTSVSKRLGHRSIHLCNDSYVAIIAEIILKSTEKRVLLRDIYEKIENNGVVMRTLPRSWKGIIRHRLTVNECFIKCSEHTGSYRHFWTIHPSYIEQFSRGIFTSARNVRSNSLSSVQNGNEEEKDRLSDAIM
ncbi:hypothetical protein FSP39_023564 [Pinctada imbricata]|uniref:Fork-head domain-containing protein n=1 Tax=Pinctada imbricata TaxID=66713 RepID=A0AA89BXY8_PINIB|nr:hypothetical protein FSP39_023564 [Pinctada imbricata]